MQQVENQDRDNQRHGNGQDHQHRRLHVAHEKEDDDAGQQCPRDDVVYQVRNRIVEQFGLVARDGELHVRIVVAELPELLVELVLELRHAGVCLLDDRQRHGVAAVRKYHALPFAGVLDDRGQFFEAEQPAVDFQKNILYILPAVYRRLEFHVVLVFPVPDDKAPQRHVRPAQRPLDGGHGDARLAEFRLVGDNQQFRGNGAAQVDHGHLGQLLDALGDDLRGKTAQRREPVGYGMPFVPVPGRLIPPYGEVDIEGRDVGDARLDYLRALHVAGQGGRRTVDLLVHFDEQVVDVRALLEGQADNAVSFAGLAAQVGQLRQLDELLPQRGDDGFIQLPGRKPLCGDLHRDIRRVDVRHERHRQQAAADNAQDEQDDGDHRHGDRPVEKFA